MSHKKEIWVLNVIEVDGVCCWLIYSQKIDGKFSRIKAFLIE